MELASLLDQHSPLKPQAKLLWSAIVEVGETQDLGPYGGGHRYMVPILGGAFIAGPDAPGLSGAVLPGGADRQFLRPDGAKELDAVYEMQVKDGPVLSIQNRVITDPKPDGTRYAMSFVSVKVEDGPFDWLNRRTLVGTLQSLRPDQPYVIIRVWEMDV